jgi:hypothetical protein
VSPTVELDEIFRSFDERTRRAFQVWMESQAQAIQGRGRDLNDAFGNLGPFADDASRLVDILNRQQGAVQRLIRDSGVVFAALSERDGQLRQLIENSNTVFTTTAARNREAQGDLHRAADLPARVAEDPDASHRVRRQHRPARHPTAPGGARARADGAGPRRAGAGPQRVLPRPRPADPAARTGIPAAQRILDDARPLLAQIDPLGRQLVPILDFPGSTSAS